MSDYLSKLKRGSGLDSYGNAYQFPYEIEAVSEIEAKDKRIAELERADIEAGAWITEWMLADKYRKPDIPAVVRQARKAYQQTLAENERLRAMVIEQIQMLDEPFDYRRNTVKRAQVLLNNLAAAKENE